MKTKADKMTKGFAQILAESCEKFGTNNVAKECGVTPRSLQLWILGQGNPNRATKVGVITIMSKYNPVVL